MKYLLIGDPHFRKENVLIMDKVCVEIISMAEAGSYDRIIILGDVLHRHEDVKTPVLTQAVTFIFNLSKIAPVVVIIGNHDRPNNSDFLSDVHPFVGMLHTPNVTIVDKVLRIDNCIYVPYVPAGRFREALATVGYNPEDAGDNEHPDYIFAHQEFKGCHMGVIVSEHGDEWSDELPVVISGHIHGYQVLPQNVVYTGALTAQSFAETGKKYVVTLDTELCKMKKHVLASVPRYQTKRITLETIQETVEALKEGKNIKKNLTTFVKVILDIDDIDLVKVRGTKIFKELAELVDKMEIKTNTTKLGKAEQYVKEHGQGATLHDVVCNLLKGDDAAIRVYNKIAQSVK